MKSFPATVRAILVIVFLLLVVIVGGDQLRVKKTIDARDQDHLRAMHFEKNAPTIVTSLVGSSAPTGAPPGLTLICSDHAWRMLVAQRIPQLKLPSPLDVIDPNRPPKTERVMQ